MASLELRLLGDIEVLRDGERQALPPSRKTRALLAYLALSGRPATRDHLCELLWELPDDPRGSLRWSLSKLRRLVDDADRSRIIADRRQVCFDAADVTIDVTTLLELTEHRLETASDEELEAAAARFDSNLMEGLELTQLHGFYAWCVSERDRVAAAQTRLLTALIERFASRPDRALPYARSLVARSPYDEALRADLIRLLVRSGREDEAEQQFRMGQRLLKEIGATSEGLLADARYESPPEPPGTTPRVSAPPPSATVARTTGLLVGRESEIAQIEACFAECEQQGRARVLLLQGEPGIGKSRLLESAADIARDRKARLLQASAFESEAIRPFALWIDALRKIGPQAVSEVFGDGSRDDRDQLFGSLTELVSREAGEGPVVLIFDDLQWCDESSAGALHYVARMCRDEPVLAVLAAREEELTDNAAAAQALRGLRRDQLLRDLHVEPLDEDAIKRIISEYAQGSDASVSSSDCRGNPLLAIELARSAGSAVEGSSLHELVRERISRLDLDAADVLKWASLLAPRIDADSLVRASGLDSNRIGKILEGIQRQALLEPNDLGFRFSHDLVARCIYSDIAPARRKVMHARVAEILEQDATVDLDLAADLAHHASMCGDPARAARAMVSAGRLCLRFFANDDALSLAARGLKWVEQLSGPERVCLTIELRDVELAAAPLEDWESTASEYVELAERALDYGALSHARLGYHMASYVRWLHGQWSHAREQTLQAERVSRSGSEEEHVIGMAETAKCLAMLERDLAQADAMLMEARSLADRNRVRHHAIPAGLGMLHFHRGEFDEAREHFLEARTLCKSAGDRVDEFQANEYLVMIDLEQNQIDSALARCDSLVEIGGKLREGSEAPFARALASVCRYAKDGEDSGLGSALDELRDADAKHRLAVVLTRAAAIDLQLGRTDEAIARGNEALECALALERATDIVLAHTALAAAHEKAGDAETAARHRDAIASVDAESVAAWARPRSPSA
jgi:DNA-binding SARP family transcriptional activator/tetratricopeptide (TPR) repeat protein